MKLFTLVAALTVGMNLIGQVQIPTWTNTLKGYGESDGPFAMTTDVFENVLVTGYFTDSIDFSTGEEEEMHYSNGNRDVFIQKLNAEGELIWAKTIGGSGSDYPLCIVTDASANIYIGGGFRESMDFDPGDEEVIRTSEAYTDAFLLKLDGNGNFQWVKTFGGSVNDQFLNLVISEDDDLFVSGNFESTVDFDDGDAEIILSSVGSSDIFFGKMNLDGDIFWAKSFGSEGLDMNDGLTIDDASNVILSGRFKEDMDVDPSEDELILETPGYTGGFVNKYSSDGEILWAKAFGDPYNFIGNHGVLCDEDNFIYTAGYFYGTGDFNPGAGTFNLTAVGEEYNLYFLKLDNDGNFEKALALGSIAGGINMGGFCRNDENEFFYVGSFDENLDFNLGAGTANKTAAGEDDVFLLSMDDEFNFNWVQTIGGNSYDYGLCITNQGNNRVVISGNYTETADFDPSEEVDEHTAVVGGDIFIQNYEFGYLEIAQNKNLDFEIFPNPNNGNFSVNIPNEDIKTLQIKDISGRIIQTIPVNNANNIKVSITAVPGIYFVTAETHDLFLTKKVVLN
ncbi:T9SS type A sorting domain-containing protein [Crocinitomix algicola]|uniref:T9SS type A sorting domain-containing protein n=1 Tax=Crocinitomix algicola TaxID=1740263 RepID=UPI0008726439|nr:T9SS type A sorting domain-containing protein [Crocinitomix algicola]